MKNIGLVKYAFLTATLIGTSFASAQRLHIVSIDIPACEEGKECTLSSSAQKKLGQENKAAVYTVGTSGMPREIEDGFDKVLFTATKSEDFVTLGLKDSAIEEIRREGGNYSKNPIVARFFHIDNKAMSNVYIAKNSILALGTDGPILADTREGYWKEFPLIDFIKKIVHEDAQAEHAKKPQTRTINAFLSIAKKNESIVNSMKFGANTYYDFPGQHLFILNRSTASEPGKLYKITASEGHTLKAMFVDYLNSAPTPKA
jgi:hypothetical protein